MTLYVPWWEFDHERLRVDEGDPLAKVCGVRASLHAHAAFVMLKQADLFPTEGCCRVGYRLVER